MEKIALILAAAGFDAAQVTANEACEKALAVVPESLHASVKETMNWKATITKEETIALLKETIASLGEIVKEKGTRKPHTATQADNDSVLLALKDKKEKTMEQIAVATGLSLKDATAAKARLLAKELILQTVAGEKGRGQNRVLAKFKIA